VYFKYLLLILSITFNLSILPGFTGDTLVKQGFYYTKIKDLKKRSSVECYGSYNYEQGNVVDKSYEYKKGVVCVVVEGEKIYSSLDQKFYLPLQKKWQKATYLKKGDALLSVTCCSLEDTLMPIKDVYLINSKNRIYDISVAKYHNYLVSSKNILVHNAMSVMVGITFAFGEKVVEFVGATIGVGVLSWLIDKNNKKIKIKPKIDFNKFNSGGGPKKPKKKKQKEAVLPPNKSKDDSLYPNGKYEDAPYHKMQQSGRKGPKPLNGQKALDKSMLIDDNSSRRISVSDKEFVVLDETSVGKYHGHTRPWDKLNDDMRAIIRQNKLVSKKGKIL